MYPIHDVDVLLLMATALSSKRRPAELEEIVSAAELIKESIPDEAKLIDSFYRISGCGLLQKVGAGYTLTPAAEDVLSGMRKKATTAERFSGVRENLAEFEPTGEHPHIALTHEEMAEAIKAHKLAAKTPGQNLLAPKPKVAENSNRRYDSRRRFGGGPRRKD